MRTLLFVLYLLVAAPIINKQEGLHLWFSIALFCLFGWVAGKENKSDEDTREKQHEEIMEILREIRLNQRD